MAQSLSALIFPDSAYGTPSSSSPGDAALAGSSYLLARADHVHGREASSGGGTPANSVGLGTSFGTASSVGTSTDYARGDHNHGTPSLASVAPGALTLGGTGVVGSATVAAREDHTHTVPSNITTTDTNQTLTGIKTFSGYYGNIVIESTGSAVRTATLGTTGVATVWHSTVPVGGVVLRGNLSDNSQTIVLLPGPTSTGWLKVANAGTSISGTLSATGATSAPTLAASGLTGATSATRYVGGTATVAPTTGTFVTGDWVAAQNGTFWMCTTGGTPGTWTQVGGGGGGTPTSLTVSGLTGATSASRWVGAVATAAPTTGTFAIGDYVVGRDGQFFVCTVAGTPGTWVSTRNLPVTASRHSSPLTFSTSWTNVGVETADTITVQAHRMSSTMGSARYLGIFGNGTFGTAVGFGRTVNVPELVIGLVTTASDVFGGTAVGDAVIRVGNTSNTGTLHLGAFPMPLSGAGWNTSGNNGATMTMDHTWQVKFPYSQTAVSMYPPGQNKYVDPKGFRFDNYYYGSSSWTRLLLTTSEQNTNLFRSHTVLYTDTLSAAVGFDWQIGVRQDPGSSYMPIWFDASSGFVFNSPTSSTTKFYGQGVEVHDGAYFYGGQVFTESGGWQSTSARPGGTTGINKSWNSTGVTTWNIEPVTSVADTGMSVGASGRYWFKCVAAALGTPVIPTLTETTGTIPAGTIYYRIGAYNATGVSVGSGTTIVLAADGGVTVSWSAVPGATGYYVYGRVSSGHTILFDAGSATSWTDDGSAVPTATAPPNENTSGPLWDWGTSSLTNGVPGAASGTNLLITNLGTGNNIATGVNVRMTGNRSTPVVGNMAQFTVRRSQGSLLAGTVIAKTGVELKQAVTVPGTPSGTGTGVLYIEGGALKFKKSTGAVTTIVA